jgi:hypothetical protein
MFSRSELLLWEAGSWGRGQFGNPEEGGTSAVESRYEATTGEDTEDSKDNAWCSKMQSVWIGDSAIVTCSYDL